MDIEQLIIVVVGSVLSIFSLSMLVRHKDIWEDYSKKYQPPKNSVLRVLTAPSKFVYRLNLIILPLIAFAGAYLVVLAFTQ